MIRQQLLSQSMCPCYLMGVWRQAQVMGNRAGGRYSQSRNKSMHQNQKEGQRHTSVRRCGRTQYARTAIALLGCRIGAKGRMMGDKAKTKSGAWCGGLKVMSGGLSLSTVCQLHCGILKTLTTCCINCYSRCVKQYGISFKKLKIELPYGTPLQYSCLGNPMDGGA